MSEWNAFLEAVRVAERELGGPQELWYRGHANPDWLLTPSLHRHNDWEQKEKLLFSEFTKTASRLFEKRGSDWEILFDMQHYWVPTRLLDWSTVMGVAIAFILHSDQGDERDGALFILDPVRLNRLSGRHDVINVPEDRDFQYQTIYWEHRPIRIERPLAIRPGQQSDRIRAQKGVFTVHGTVGAGFEANAQDCFKKIVLPAAAKAEARDFLKWANLDEYTIYPDIVGMARHITRKIL
ncbi:FRG domain-containing protein [Stenotrophomonas maltophilia]|uniref:FRG domain-containing protein n=1 Tax=Stenotrophomonas maltophilia TaxID=40324 RepID=UPI0009A1F289|nr:FRG domain-containing protein [Stenotrophomonas maltophilia]